MPKKSPFPPKDQLPSLVEQAARAERQEEVAAWLTTATGRSPGPAGSRLVPLHAAALYAQVHDDTIRRRITSGQLTRYRFGPKIIWVDLDEIDALLRPSAVHSN